MGNATSIADPRHARAEILRRHEDRRRRARGPAPTLILLRPKSIVAEPTGGPHGVVPVDADVPEDVRGARVVERHEETASGPRLEDAKVVLAGGRGLAGPTRSRCSTSWRAAIGGAAVGASRAAVDAGWVPYSYQIGQTGKTVKPEVYLAAGISGALQHIVGMKGAKRIVAINKDADAPLLATGRPRRGGRPVAGAPRPHGGDPPTQTAPEHPRPRGRPGRGGHAVLEARPRAARRPAARRGSRARRHPGARAPASSPTCSGSASSSRRPPPA